MVLERVPALVIGSVSKTGEDHPSRAMARAKSLFAGVVALRLR